MSGSAAATASSDWDTTRYARHARFVSEYGVSVVEWLAPMPGERILDLGCGDGVLTATIARAGADVVGVDLSDEFVEATRARGCDASRMDGQTLCFDTAFDAVFSNAALHWMRRNPQAVLQGVARALKPGGRFVAELGAQGNIAAIHEALRAAAIDYSIEPDQIDPWFFPAPEDYKKQLVDAGFEIQREKFFERPTPLPGDIRAWLRTLAAPFINGFAEADRQPVIERVVERLCSSMRARDGGWIVPYVRYRFAARWAGH